MTTSNNIIEMGLTAREIKFVALGTSDLTRNEVYDRQSYYELPARTENIILKGISSSKKDRAYVMLRCYYIYFGKSLAA